MRQATLEHDNVLFFLYFVLDINAHPGSMTVKRTLKFAGL